MVRNLRELYQYRALLWALTQRELSARYRSSVLGFFWTFLNPLMLMLIYSLVFGVFMRQAIEHYTYYLLLALLPWLWFASSVTGGTSSIADRRDLLTKVRFPAQVLPATIVTTNLLNFLLSLPLVLGLGLLDGVWPTWHALVLVPVLVVQGLFTLAVTYVLSALNVRYRDLQHLVSNVVTFWFFATPVVYPADKIPAEYQDLLTYGNPMAPLMAAWRDTLYFHRLPEAQPILIVALESIALLWIGALIFESRREEFAEVV